MKHLLGLGLRHPHYQQVLEQRPDVGWWEVHSENFFQAGGPALQMLCAIREQYPLSLHGVGLSLGSASGVRAEHLLRLKNLIGIVEPFLVSEHLSWSQVGGVYLPDLLPLPYTAESLAIIAANISHAQDYLGRELLIENPSSYLEYTDSQGDEVDFIVTLCQRTGAKLLLDVNNVFVSCTNHGWNTQQYLDAIPLDLVAEIHVAGHSLQSLADDTTVRIDTHDAPVCSEVWNLLANALTKFGPKPTLLEWDAKIPPLAVLMAESRKALAYFSKQGSAHENA